MVKTLLTWLLVSWGAVAQAEPVAEASIWMFSPALETVAADLWLRDALSAERAGDLSNAVTAWQHVDRLAPEMNAIATFKIAELELAQGVELQPAQLAELRVSTLPGAAAIVARATWGDESTIDEVDRAWTSNDGEALCEAFRESVSTVSDAIKQRFFARCTGPDEFSWAEKNGVRPGAKALMDRAERLYESVRFTPANETLDAIDVGSLDAKQRCEWEYLKGQTVFRLRRRDEALEHWEKATGACADAASPTEVRALYAAGRRWFDLGQLDKAKPHFTAIVSKFPDRSHVDDALMYLARIARGQNDRTRELAVLAQILSDHPDGDMVFETAWEVYEADYRAGDDRAFVDGVTALKLPERDHEYFSQGRLEYFLGRAYGRLGEPDMELTKFREAWRKYPLSFYGYLSHEVLVSKGETPTLDLDKNVPAWLTATRWKFSAAARLLAAGAPDLAGVAAYSFGRNEGDLWRRAYALDRAHAYPISHNIVRRQIPGLPWLVEGRLNEVQARLAWPNPFASTIAEACSAEATQNGSAILDPALPASIMREESSFIEDVESYAGALGLMQLMPRTALGHDSDFDEPVTPDQLKTADVNVRVGVDHLYHLARKFKGHPVLIAAAYNAGGGAVSRWIHRQPNDDIALFVEDIPPLQTRDYTKRVMGSYAAYQFLRGGALDPRILAPAR